MELRIIGNKSKAQLVRNISHLEEEICLGFICRPMKNKIKPIPQAINCFLVRAGAMELTIRMLMANKKTRLIKTGNQGDLDINKF